MQLLPPFATQIGEEKQRPPPSQQSTNETHHHRPPSATSRRKDCRCQASLNPSSPIAAQPLPRWFTVVDRSG
nr:hypothetical protein Itr_chr02CG11670 [Ipomoea trifida]GLL19677.1 hypothetical protein Itr_chr02CG11680 [Ipomoea trifida]